MKTILMFDYEESTAEQARALLPLAGYELVHFAYIQSLEEVNLILDTVRPDIIMTAAVLLFMKGTDLCFHCKTHPKFHHVPVIVYSAEPVDPQVFAKSKADVLISKPFQKQELLAALSNLTGR